MVGWLAGSAPTRGVLRSHHFVRVLMFLVFFFFLLPSVGICPSPFAYPHPTSSPCPTMMHYITSHHIVSRRIASHRVATRDLLRTHTHTDHAESARADHPRDHLAWEPAREHGAWFTSRSVDRSIAPSHPFFAPLLSRLSSRLSSLASALFPRSCCAHAALVAAAWFLSRCCASVRASAEQVFKGYSVQTLTESTSFVQDLKLGHYIKVPPRATFVGASSSLSIRRMRSRLLTCAHAVRTLCICFLCICFLLCFFWGAARQCNWWPRSSRRFCRWG